MSTTKTIDGQTIEMDHLDKVIFPDIILTQGDLLDYYLRIAEQLLPHLKDRPLTLQRFPDGIEVDGCYQKNRPDYFPDWIEATEIPLVQEDRIQQQVICNSKATLAFLVDQGTIAFHTWLSRTPQLKKPDKLIFDLDPADDDFDRVRQAAQIIREQLNAFDLHPLVMTTGSRGLHVVVPLQAKQTFEEVRQFAKQLAEVTADQHPDILTTETRKAKRDGRLFLDYLRNAYGQTGVAPYSVRALSGAPVATPLDWKELEDHELNAQSYTVENLFRRLGQKEDPWKEWHRHAKSLTDAQNQLEEWTD